VAGVGQVSAPRHRHRRRSSSSTSDTHLLTQQLGGCVSWSSWHLPQDVDQLSRHCCVVGWCVYELVDGLDQYHCFQYDPALPSPLFCCYEYHAPDDYFVCVCVMMMMMMMMICSIQQQHGLHRPSLLEFGHSDLGNLLYGILLVCRQPNPIP
jgi:hypothetical protein